MQALQPDKPKAQYPVLCLVFAALLLLPSALMATEPYFGPHTYHFTQSVGSACPIEWWTGDCPEIVRDNLRWHGYLFDEHRTLEHWWNTHELVFDFESPDYFGPDLTGHWAIAIRADGVSDRSGNGRPDLEGRGLILGNVSGIDEAFPCGPTGTESTITMEAFWAGGNCVFGRSTEGPRLENNTRYRVQLVSSVQAIPWLTLFINNRYRLWRIEPSGQAILIGSGTYYETLTGSIPLNNPAAKNLGGFFITEVMSQHSWQFAIFDLQLFECGSFEPQCSNY
ncbi:MAG: hypothetical protein AAF446_08800 [Pseudomonadota bacterium]